MTRTDPAAATTPPVPAAALAALLRHHRTRAGLTQHQVARRVEYSRSSVANAENGDVRSPDFYRRCDEVLGAGGAIVTARRALDDRALSSSDPLTAVPVEEAVEHLRRHWHLLVRTDHLLGPQAALPGTLAQLATLTALLRGAAGPARTALLSLSARYAVTASWLQQDTGSPADAAAWAARALERAHESDDRTSIAWALHRRSRLRGAEGDAEHALSLARAALRQGTAVQRPLAAALRVQCARAAAAVGDHRTCDDMLVRAASLAEAHDTAGDDSTGYGGHCTRPWVLAVRGECALRLGSPSEAVAPLRTALALLAPVYRRNRGLVAGWLAEAYTRLGEHGDADRAAAECRLIGAATGSASVLTQAGRIDGQGRSAA